MTLTVDDVLRTLEERGLLLLQDATRPSLVGLVVGAPLQGSWWSHPKGGEIFRLAEALDDSGVVKSAKLVDGKVTFVHKRLWDALAAVGRSCDTWQMKGLSGAARLLMAKVDNVPQRETSKAAKELEKRLLVDARSVHTESGKHVTELTRWPRSSLAVPDALAQLEHAARVIGADGALPWQAKRPASSTPRTTGPPAAAAPPQSPQTKGPARRRQQPGTKAKQRAAPSTKKTKKQPATATAKAKRKRR